MHNCCPPHIIKENFENFLVHQCNYILLSQVYCVWQVVKTPTFIFNNPVYSIDYLVVCVCVCVCVLIDILKVQRYSEWSPVSWRNTLVTLIICAGLTCGPWGAVSEQCLTLKATTTRSLFVAISQAAIVAPVVLVSLFYCIVAPGTVLQTGQCYSWFQTFTVFWTLYAFFWVIPQHPNFICPRFRTLCSIFIGG